MPKPSPHRRQRTRRRDVARRRRGHHRRSSRGSPTAGSPPNPRDRRSRSRSAPSCRARPTWPGSATRCRSSTASASCAASAATPRGSTATSSAPMERGCCRACRLEPSADGTSMATRAPAGNGDRASSGSKRPTGWSSSSASPIAPSIVSACSRKTASSTPADGRSPGSRRSARPTAWRSSSRSRSPADGRRDRVTDGAISAIALHGDPAADASLERLVAVSQPEALRKKVTFWLGNTRGARGLATLRRVLKEDPSAEVQKGAVFGVSQSREAGAFDVLLGARANRRQPAHSRRGDLLARAEGRPESRGTPSPSASSRIPTPRSRSEPSSPSVRCRRTKGCRCSSTSRAPTRIRPCASRRCSGSASRRIRGRSSSLRRY